MDKLAKLSVWKSKQLEKATKICMKSGFANFPNPKTQGIVNNVFFKYPPLSNALNSCYANLSDLFYTMHWTLGLYDGDNQFFDIFKSSMHAIPLSIAFFPSTVSYCVSAWQELRERDVFSSAEDVKVFKSVLLGYFVNDKPLPEKFLNTSKLRVLEEQSARIRRDTDKSSLTNYDVVEFMIASISEYPEKGGNEALFFSLYTLLLHKVFDIEILYCQEFIDIYCKKRVSNEADYQNLYSTMIDLVQNFDNTWERAVSRPRDASFLSNPVYCLAKDIQAVCPQYNDFDMQQNLSISNEMSSFIRDISDKFGWK